MQEWFRLITLHPVMTHLTLGAMPIIGLAYVLAALRRSERWTFVGDVVTLIAAVVTPVTTAMGLLSNALVAWPGGLSSWRWLHLGAGVAATVALLGLASVRLARRRRDPYAATGWRTAGAAAGLGLLMGFTGWIGGELLVFRAGVAVVAAGDGALAPSMPLLLPRDVRPHDVHGAMGHVRAAWASATTAAARMIVHGPADDAFATITTDAQAVQRLAQWIAEDADAATRPRDTAAERHEVAGHEEAAAADGGALSLAREQQLASFAEILADKGAALETAARAQDLAAVTRAMGDLSATCARCHEALRWSAPAP